MKPKTLELFVKSLIVKMVHAASQDKKIVINNEKTFYCIVKFHHRGVTELRN